MQRAGNTTEIPFLIPFECHDRTDLMFFAGPANKENEATAEEPWKAAGYSFGARQVWIQLWGHRGAHSCFPQEGSH